MQAIALNGVAVKANTDAFNWGRVMAHDPALVILPQPQAALGLEGLIDHRTAHLTKFQDARLAARYRTLLDRVRQGVLGSPAQADEILRTVAANYAKVLAYKDEYEVARLYVDPGFAAALNAQFTGGFRMAFNLAPPFLPGRSPNGRPKKREFGAGTMGLFKLLARLKGLRGTLFDPFGYTAERRAERALIGQYEGDVADVLAVLNPDNAATAQALLALPDDIRGFGPVKAEAMALAARRRGDLRAALGLDERTGLHV